MYIEKRLFEKYILDKHISYWMKPHSIDTKILILRLICQTNLLESCVILAITVISSFLLEKTYYMIEHISKKMKYKIEI